ncbi:MAG: hypothetical protein ED557_12975 [Balneola sp.]|nr:MAG: hypothetical protein ED557_12975 [Balneola sp.]
MYHVLLTSHSIFRWLVLISLLISIVLGIRGWVTKKKFDTVDNRFRHWTITLTHIQFLIGIILYPISPIIRYFFENFGDAVKISDIRFFGMEHPIMMILAVGLITFGSSSAKRNTDDLAKFKTMTIWFSIGLIIILVNIPWEFSSYVSRPHFRFF